MGWPATLGAGACGLVHRRECGDAQCRCLVRRIATQREAKALLKEDLFRVLDAMGEGVKDARDRALLLIGFAGGFRRSEVVGVDCGDVERVRQGLIITLRRSKRASAVRIERSRTAGPQS